MKKLLMALVVIALWITTVHAESIDWFPTIRDDWNTSINAYWKWWMLCEYKVLSDTLDKEYCYTETKIPYTTCESKLVRVDHSAEIQKLKDSIAKQMETIQSLENDYQRTCEDVTKTKSVKLLSTSATEKKIIKWKVITKFVSCDMWYIYKNGACEKLYLMETGIKFDKKGNPIY